MDNVLNAPYKQAHERAIFSVQTFLLSAAPGASTSERGVSPARMCDKTIPPIQEDGSACGSAHRGLETESTVRRVVSSLLPPAS